MIGALSDRATKPRRSGRERAGTFLDIGWRKREAAGAISFLRARNLQAAKEIAFNFSME